MALVNEHFLKLPGNYLFADIAKKVNAYKIAHPKQRVISLGIGDVTQPLCPAVIQAMHKAVEEMANKESFKGYGFNTIVEILSAALATVLSEATTSCARRLSRTTSCHAASISMSTRCLSTTEPRATPATYRRY